jgi:hypothetical protein
MKWSRSPGAHGTRPVCCRRRISSPSATAREYPTTVTLQPACVALSTLSASKATTAPQGRSAGIVGKAARRHRQAGSQGHRPQARPQTAPATAREDDPRGRAQAAITRLVRGNPPGRVSLAGAYALGYAEIGLAQQ